jgi:site-specific recombinase XerD
MPKLNCRRSAATILTRRFLSKLSSASRQMEEFLARSLARNTVRGYESDWRDFEGWCERQNRSALPAAAVVFP